MPEASRLEADQGTRGRGRARSGRRTEAREASDSKMEGQPDR